MRYSHTHDVTERAGIILKRHDPAAFRRLCGRRVPETDCAADETRSSRLFDDFTKNAYATRLSRAEHVERPSCLSRNRKRAFTLARPHPLIRTPFGRSRSQRTLYAPSIAARFVLQFVNPRTCECVLYVIFTTRRTCL